MATPTRPARCRAIPWRWRRDLPRSICWCASRGWQRLEARGAELERCCNRCWRGAPFPVHLVRVGSLFWLSFPRGAARRAPPRRSRRARARASRHCSTRMLDARHLPAAVRLRGLLPVARAQQRRPHALRAGSARGAGGGRNESDARLSAHRARAGGGVRGAGRLVAPRSARLHGREGAGGARRLRRTDAAAQALLDSGTSPRARAAAAAGDRRERRARRARTRARAGAHHRGAPPLQPVRLGGLVLPAGARGCASR